MDYLWSSIKDFFKVLFSYIIAVARLFVWTIIFFFTGLQRTLFMRSEIVSVEFRVTPLRCDMEEADDKLAYIDKLCTENPDLAVAVEDEEFDFSNDDNNDFDFPDSDEFPPNDEEEGDE